jgi:hypothetical protein
VQKTFLSFSVIMLLLPLRADFRVNVLSVLKFVIQCRTFSNSLCFLVEQTRFLRSSDKIIKRFITTHGKFYAFPGVIKLQNSRSWKNHTTLQHEKRSAGESNVLPDLLLQPAGTFSFVTGSRDILVAAFFMSFSM